MTKDIRLSLRFLVYAEGGQWFGHCLDLDIVEAGATPREAVANVLSLCKLQIETALAEGDLDSIFRSAPPEYWRMFSLAQDFTPDEDGAEFIDDARFRELTFA